MNIDLEPWQIKEIAKCYASPEYFVENYCWLEQRASAGVSDKTSIIPFRMGTRPPTKAEILEREVPLEATHFFQRQILQWLHERENVLTLKSRRVGCSWIAAAYAAWLINFHENVNILFISRTGSEAKKILEKVRFILLNLAYHGDGAQELRWAKEAGWLRGDISVNNTERMAIGWRNNEGYIVYESRVDSITTTDNAARGNDATFIVFDELAFYEHPNETWASAMPALAHGGQWMAISTPGGIGDVFHRLCVRGDLAEKDQLDEILGYKYIKIHWSEAGISRHQIEKSIVGATDETAKQEWEWHFIAPGTVVFHPTHLAACFRPPDEFPEIATELEEYRRMVDLSVIDRTGIDQYFSGVDTAAGKAHRKSNEKDYHCFIALTRSGIQAFTYYSKEPLSKWAGATYDDPGTGTKVEMLGLVSQFHRDWPGSCYIEEEGPGYVAINRHVLPDDGFSQLVSVSMKQKMKKGIIERLILAVESHQIVITDLFTYQCMQVYQQTAPGVYEAPSGYYDDPVMALAIAYDNLLRYGAVEFSWGSTTDGLKRSDPSMANFLGAQIVPIEIPGYSRRMVDELVPEFTVPYMDEYKTFTEMVDRDMLDKLKRDI